ncbi:dioxygenase [Paractinoplanes toevensis]|uniref:Catechol dioxygenase N-terminal domain-containing protein n=1 Tax=Paractinoplanes toevensis TaxID=571911 RepID=A0A919W425_9ACTN|nr:dioxygenase [Actinoplanes toevensis]GIM95462.1 hypothetical protein Ato02nite_072550 [Actinoplanes toevensis]
MDLFSEERSADVVAASFGETADPRLRQVMTSLVRHLHAFVKDVELTEAESPPRALGESIALDEKGTPCPVSGQVTGPGRAAAAGLENPFRTLTFDIGLLRS